MSTSNLMTFCLVAYFAISCVSARPQHFVEAPNNQINNPEAEMLDSPLGLNAVGAAVSGGGIGGGGGLSTGDLNAEIQRLLMDNWGDARNLLMMAARSQQQLVKRNRAFRQCYFNPISCFRK